MKEKVSIGNIIKFSGAFLACAIGSGFATGQEIMQFFSSFGAMGIPGTVVTTVIFAWVGSKFMKHGFELQLEQPADIIPYYFGKKFGTAVQYISQIFLFGVFVIMIAGAGATLNEYFGLDPMVGRIGIAVVTCLTVLLGLTKITDVLGTLGSVIIVFAVGLGIVSYLTNAGNLIPSLELIPTLGMLQTQGGWLGSAILYPAFNAVVVVILASSIGKNANSAKEAGISGMIGGALFGGSVIVMNLGIVANIGELFDKAVPTLFLAQNFSPVLATVFSVIICCGIYTTAVPLLWGNVRQFAADGTKKSVVLAIAFTALGLILGMTDFKALVNIIYPFSGYLGVLYFVLVAYREHAKKGRAGRLRVHPVASPQAQRVLSEN